MKLWPFTRRDDGLTIPEYPLPPMEPLRIEPQESQDFRAEEAFAEAYAEIRLLKTMVENLKRQLAERDAKARSQGTSKGNVTKELLKLCEAVMQSATIETPPDLLRMAEGMKRRALGRMGR